MASCSGTYYYTIIPTKTFSLIFFNHILSSIHCIANGTVIGILSCSLKFVNKKMGVTKLVFELLKFKFRLRWL